MKILAIEASGLVAGCALLEDGVLTADYNIQFKKTHSQTLLPMMEELRRMTDLRMDSLDAVALTSGPGSFTGLRIGAATAKGIGLALDIPVLPVPTLESMAYNLCGSDALVCSMIDARRTTVFTGLYMVKDGLQCLIDGGAMPVTQILQKASDLAAARGEQIVFLGDGASAYKQEIDAAVTEGITYRYAPAHMNRQRAAATAALAYLRWQEQGEACFVSADDFRPDYMKASQAEREKAYAQQTGQMDALAAGTLLSGGKK